jgi:hypothetical protein
MVQRLFMYEFLLAKAGFWTNKLTKEAAKFGKYSVCKLLIDLGADANCRLGKFKYED